MQKKKAIQANQASLYGNCSYAGLQLQDATGYVATTDTDTAGLDDKTAEGVRLHAQAAAILNGTADIDDTTSGDVIYYVHTVRSTPGILTVETELDLDRYMHTGSKGIADAIVYDDERQHLTIYDYKTGDKLIYPWHEVNNTEGNGTAQLICYAYAVIMDADIRPSKVTLAIVQHKETRAHDFTYADIMALAERYRGNFAKIQAGIHEPTHGNHCRQCPMHGTCPYYRDNVNATIANIARSIDTMTDTDLILSLATLGYMIQGYQAKAQTLLLNDPQIMDHADNFEVSKNEKSETIRYTGPRILNKNEM